ncbi:hypothetical protein HYZ70_02425 [Candidatus Curtissbacteria bacterium]|nr:hypothetical protein [Candidatus Curtissbacteria bacterium]
MQLLAKFLFVTLAAAGIAAVFYVSWFWRALIIPMVVILLWDVVASFLREKQS